MARRVSGHASTMSSRVVRLAVVVVLCTVSLLGWARPPMSARASSPLLFGAFPSPRNGQSHEQAVLALESQIGRQLDTVRVYDYWDSPFPTSFETWLRDTGHTVVLSVRAFRLNGTVVPWRAIADAQPGSQLYSEMVAWAVRVKGFNAHILFIFHHEPESVRNDPNGGAEDFIAAWRKVITVFRQQGVTNTEYVWTATDYAFWRTDGRKADLWYPGDATLMTPGRTPTTGRTAEAMCSLGGRCNRSSSHFANGASVIPTSA
jgi:hypothetical protein